MRLLLVGMGAFDEQPGGLNRYFAELAGALRNEGVDTSAVVASARAPLLRRLLAVRRAVRKEIVGADVLDVHFALYAVAALTVRRARRLPLVVHFQGPWADEGAVTGDSRLAVFVKRRIELAVYRRADAFVTLSSAFAGVLVDRYGVARSRIHVMPPGVDLDRFRPHTEPRSRVDAPSPVILSVRRLVPRMGLDVLLRAWAAIVGDGAEGDLVIVGDGPSRVSLETLASTLGISGRIRFMGSVSDVELPALYRTADVTVVPTITLEGYGLVVLESLASGVPVVGTDAGSLPEVLEPLDPTLVVAAGSIDQLAERLRDGLHGVRPLPDARACRRHAERFSWSRVAQHHVSLYEGAVRGDPITVVYLDHTAAPSGGELALARLLEATIDVDAHVILGEDGPLAGRLRDAGISVEVLALARRAGSLRRGQLLSVDAARATFDAALYTFRLVRVLRRRRPDVVHTNSLKSALYGGAAARVAGCPVVWHVRDRIDGDSMPAPAARVIRALGRWVPSAIIANSDSTLASLGNGRPGQRRVAIPSPTTFGTADRTAPGTDELHVAMVGRLAPWKGQDVFLRAFAKAFPDGGATATIVGGAHFGDDDTARSLPHLVEQLGLERRVALLGHRDDVEAILREVDVLVHASTKPEPFGQVVIEGMAVGLTVIATNAGGPSEIVRNGVDGILVPPGDVDALADALTEVAFDPELRARLGAAASMRAEDFRPVVVARSVRDVYCDLLRR